MMKITRCDGVNKSGYSGASIPNLAFPAGDEAVAV